jgi:hypothetical protein
MIRVVALLIAGLIFLLRLSCVVVSSAVEEASEQIELSANKSPRLS